MVKAIFLILILFCCNSCIKTIHISGHLLEEKELKELKNAKNKQDIESLLGSPTSSSSFGPETWYYITAKKESIAFFQDKILEQNIIAIRFKSNSSIESIGKYTEKDLNQTELVTEYTLIKGNDATVTQRLFQNFGRFRHNKPSEPAKPRSGF